MYPQDSGEQLLSQFDALNRTETYWSVDTTTLVHPKELRSLFCDKQSEQTLSVWRWGCNYILFECC